MNLQSPEIKTFIHDLVTYEDGVDAKGNRVPRSIYPKEHLRGVREVQDVIRGNIEVLIGSEWKMLKDVQQGDAPTAERHKDIELTLSSAAISAVKHFYNTRNEVIAISVKALDEFQELFLKEKAA